VRGTEHAKQRLGMRRAGADFEVEWLLQEAPVRRPELREPEDEVLKSQSSVSVAPQFPEHAQ